MIYLRAFSSSLSKVSVFTYIHVTWVFVPSTETSLAVPFCLCSYLINVSPGCQPCASDKSTKYNHPLSHLQLQPSLNDIFTIIISYI